MKFEEVLIVKEGERSQLDYSTEVGVVSREVVLETEPKKEEDISSIPGYVDLPTKQNDETQLGKEARSKDWISMHRFLERFIVNSNTSHSLLDNRSIST